MHPHLADTENPLLAAWSTPHGIPPFSLIHAEHFEPAFETSLRIHRSELDAISHNADAPTFENTIASFDRSGKLFKRIEMVFSNLAASETSPALQAVERIMAGPLAAHENAIYTDAALFKRIDTLHASRGELGLDQEQMRLLERIHLDFVRAGATLAPEAKKRYGEVMEALATLNTRFSQNVLADEGEFQLSLKTEEDQSGLPEFVRATAKQAAIERDIHDAHLITLSRSHITPFLTFSSQRPLREKAFKAWLKRGEFHEGDTQRDNKLIAASIMALRLEQANLHGYRNYAEYALADTMAGTPAAVEALLNNVWQRASARARIEAQDLQDTAAAIGDQITIEPWDWFYYAEKVRRARFDFDEASVKPYFCLERITEAAFDCAARLFGIQFRHLPEAIAYHPDVKTYEVLNSQDQLVAIFMHDNFARSTKRGGAWMSAYRVQSRMGDNGATIIPIIVNNNNFAKGAPGQPTLLSYDDARTLFHEFGHGLHGMMSNVRFERLSGTNVLRDFVELPSQLFEHWLSEPEVLKKHARHYQTNEAIPDALIRKMQLARTFNQGFDAATFCASGLVDLRLHLLEDLNDLDLAKFEQIQLAEIQMPKQLYMRHRLPHFLHLFASAGYASQYYVYLWAEVLDADAYGAFKEAGDPFDSATAQRLLKFIYSSGGTLPPMLAYEKFRGRAPTVEPMLRKKGLIEV
jgi:peptidyl-dipeptidase Dcp